MPARRSYMVFGFVISIALAIGVLIAFTRYHQRKQFARFSASAQGTIIMVDLTRYRTANASRERTDTIVNTQDGKRRTTTHIRFRYVVNGNSIENEQFVRGDKRENYTTGATTKVCYDPAYPQESVMVDANEKCGAE